jgi:hypothetical protein
VNSVASVVSNAISVIVPLLLAVSYSTRIETPGALAYIALGLFGGWFGVCKIITMHQRRELLEACLDMDDRDGEATLRTIVKVSLFQHFWRVLLLRDPYALYREPSQ